MRTAFNQKVTSREGEGIPSKLRNITSDNKLTNVKITPVDNSGSNSFFTSIMSFFTVDSLPESDFSRYLSTLVRDDDVSRFVRESVWSWLIKEDLKPTSTINENPELIKLWFPSYYVSDKTNFGSRDGSVVNLLMNVVLNHSYLQQAVSHIHFASVEDGESPVSIPRQDAIDILEDNLKVKRMVELSRGISKTGVTINDFLRKLDGAEQSNFQRKFAPISEAVIENANLPEAIFLSLDKVKSMANPFDDVMELFKVTNDKRYVKEEDRHKTREMEYIDYFKKYYDVCTELYNFVNDNFVVGLSDDDFIKRQVTQSKEAIEDARKNNSFVELADKSVFIGKDNTGFKDFRKNFLPNGNSTFPTVEDDRVFDEESFKKYNSQYLNYYTVGNNTLVKKAIKYPEFRIAAMEKILNSNTNEIPFSYITFISRILKVNFLVFNMDESQLSYTYHDGNEHIITLAIDNGIYSKLIVEGNDSPLMVDSGIGKAIHKNFTSS